MIRVVLASRSPARLATLVAAGITPLVRVSHVDEDAVLAALPGGRAFSGGPTSPAEEVSALAAAKCRAVVAEIAGPRGIDEGDRPGGAPARRRPANSGRSADPLAAGTLVVV